VSDLTGRASVISVILKVLTYLLAAERFQLKDGKWEN